MGDRLRDAESGRWSRCWREWSAAASRSTRQVLSRLSGDFAQTAARVEAEIQEIAGEPVNVGSPKQIGDILFGKMGLSGGTKTKTGAWSTTAQVLDDLAEQGHALPSKILEWRQVSKLKSTYTDALPTYVNRRRPIACTHHLRAGRDHHGAGCRRTSRTCRTSRFAPRDGRKDPPRLHRGRPGTSWCRRTTRRSNCGCLREIADVAGAAPGVPRRARHSRDDRPPKMFGVPIKDMPERGAAPCQGDQFRHHLRHLRRSGLANQLGIAREEASAYIKKYFERFPGIRAYMDETKEFCRRNGYVTTLFGRKMYYPEIKASNASHRAFNERAAINARLQGTAADIIRRAMIRVEDALAEKKLSAQMLLQVHDEPDLRGARQRGRGDAAGGAEGDAGRAVPGRDPVAAAPGRCPRRQQLGRGALESTLPRPHRHSGDRRRREPGIHSSARYVARWIPGSCFARPGMTARDLGRAAIHIAPRAIPAWPRGG